MVKKTLLILFVLFGFLGTEAKQNEALENVDIISRYNGIYGSTENRNPPISVDITSHTLTISILQNVGITQIMIKDANGAMVALDNMISSPNTTCIYISNAGYYRIDIVLSNGDIYYGYFTVYDGIVI
ncbi:MAG: DUF3244 domain-containing protein [Bacteroidales bacterium]|nr:DUF3244 domain-containing protein [Bacteroidales bacterium]